MAPAQGGTNKTAKEVLDEIGKEVQEKATEDALTYRNDLQGNLSQAKFHGVPIDVKNPCDLNYEIHTNVVKGRKKENPCRGREEKRFSDVLSGQCAKNTIKDSVTNSVGACAPFRRLHVCDRNLELIKTDENTSTHDILVDVLLTAKHEGESLVKHYKEYIKKNRNFNICTVLARSFADIGDIVRGKDLYLGYDDEEKEKRKQLEKNLKKFFQKIHDDVMKTSGRTNGKKSAEAQKRYNDATGNYYKLREDWWNANRDQVWKAITCDAADNDEYFENSSDGLYVFSNGQCGRNEGKVPTNLDYVPQHLRWFDEWAEDFCRKRNITLKSAKEKCGGEGNTKYCSLNGYDCTKVFEKKDSCSSDGNCTACSNICIAYDAWLRNQRNEFEKQKIKYTKEIEKYKSSSDKSNSNISNKYYNEFYENFGKKEYETLQNFLKLLNKGMYCQEKIEEEEVIDFNKDEDMVFHRSEYCQPCPDCVVQCKGGKCTEDKKNDKCRSKIIKKILQSEEPTEIHVLNSDDKQGDITKKLEVFCSSTTNYEGRNVQKWKCYNKNSDYNNCEMNISSYKDSTDANVMLSVECFHSWAKNLLIDTIKWEHQLKNCINNTNVTYCESKCIKNCECYEKWIKRKEHEWEKVKNVFGNNNRMSYIYYNNLSRVFDSFLFQVMFALDQDEKGKWDQFTEDLKKKFEPSKTNTPTGKSQDAIEFLLDHLKDNALTCRDNNSNESCDVSKKVKTNPCGKNPSASNNLVRVKRLAEMMQRYARKQLEKRGGEINLKGDATKGTYRQGGPADGFKNVCSINQNHTNVQNNNRAYTYQGPCTGKDGSNGGVRMKIGTPWKPGRQIQMSAEDIYMPPRRQHMCTSNLEYLQTKDGPLKQGDGKLVNNSFLGDVLLSAKMDAGKIIELYKKQNNKSNLTDPEDNESACRALRYSFADLGDIIRGRDLWDKNSDAKRLQTNLKEIFTKIKEELPEDIKKKYDKDGTDHKLLREDWWEANRHQVWRAMKCAIENDKDMKCNGIPIEDYIPQRLRWMTEWAEWFCKEQSRLYNKLVADCKSCKGKAKSCTQKDGDCTKCKAACDNYNKKIKPWEEQWEKIKNKYAQLYKKALDSVNGKEESKKKTASDAKDQQVVHFLAELIRKSGGGKGGKNVKTTVSPTTTPNTLYSSAAGYIHHELGRTVGCNTQKEFCYSKNGKYAFKDPPKGYEEACKCNDRNPKPQPAPKKEDEDACDVVKPLLKDKGETDDIDGCNQKYKAGKDKYPGWDCNSQIHTTHNGACMPPRRQKLCVSGLTKTDRIKAIEYIRTEFIKSAAIETHFAWDRYKEDNGEAEAELKNGNIPEGFKRQMYYTFGDYRDIFFGRDISTHAYISGVSPKVITILEKENDAKYAAKQNSNNELLDDWWDQHGKDIWEGMLCALTHKISDEEKKKEIKNKYSYKKLNESPKGSNKVEDFAKKPQFLRWFIEWGDEFCAQREEKEAKVKVSCSDAKDYDGCKNTKSNASCVSACKVYEDYITKKKVEYTKQKGKFDAEKITDKEGYEGFSTKDASEYLKKKCLDDTCNCMQKVKNNTEYWNTPNKTYTNSNLEKRCECQPPQEPPPGPEGGARSDSGPRDTTPRPAGSDARSNTVPSPPPRPAGDTVHEVAEVQEEEEEDEDGDLPEDQDEDVEVAGAEEEEDLDVGVARILRGRTNSPDEDEDEASEEEDDDDDDAQDTTEVTGQGEEETAEDHQDTTEETVDQEKAEEDKDGGGETPQKETQPKVEVNPCDIVKTLFTTTETLKEACPTKYVNGREKFPNWKCISSGSDASGSICIPPRRRKLYLHKIEGVDTTVSSDGETTTPITHDALREAFIQTAAVETFFLWHRYKKIKEKERQEELQNGTFLLPPAQKVSPEDNPEHPQKKLKEGKIPEEFKRQMFYTLGDYRDLCVGVKDDVAQALEASGDNKSGDKNIKDISEKIKSVIEKSGEQTPPGPKPGQTTTKPEEWWQKNGEHIWNAMICALTHNTDTRQVDDQVKGQLFENGKNTPKNSQYQYKNVTISSVSSNGGPIGNIKLEQFASRPTFLRWLEEWGEEFCRKQYHKLERIKEECHKDGNRNCDDDGFECKEMCPCKDGSFETLKCPSCAKSCKSYKKWISRKKDEFTKQKGAYEKQKKDAEGNNNDYKEFSKTLRNYNDAAAFLNSLKNGPCSKNDDDSVQDEIKFDDERKTFGHETYCKPCSKITVKCKENNHCDNSKPNDCRNINSISAEDIEKRSNSTQDVTMSVSDSNTNGNKFYDLNDCIKAGIFKGIREDVWKCGEYCGVDICTLEKTNNEERVSAKENDNKNQIILIRVLFKRWLESFLEDYNKINDKISHCMKNDKKSPCINGCQNKCNCVEKWIEKKKSEWGKVRERYINQYRDKNSNEAFEVKSFLETLIPQIPVVTDKGKHDSLTQLKKLLKCNCSEKSENSNEKDVVLCLLKKLEDKAKNCKDQASGEPCPQTTSENPDDEDILLEEENPVEAPNICPKVEEPEPVVEEEKCDLAEAPSKESSTEENSGEGSNSEQNPRSKPEEEPPPPTSSETDTPPPAPPTIQPSQADQPTNSISDILSSTIPFGIAIALTSIVFLFLKKKTKSSVDLLRVLNIPKGEYGMPTLKSSNRYIPYASDRYKGKTYIYMEGDSDSGHYYEDTTDVTSSESEYEELDINDIYVPGSPKYKTLIEVVLEPSGNNTTASGKNTPSDTQNDIQNDGIPSSKITDNEWNTLKDEFISQYLQSEQPNDVPNDYTSGNSSTNTNITTTSRHNVEEKPFIMSIHDRNLYTGEEINYNVNMVNTMDDIPINRDNNVYSGIDLINDALNGDYDIYDEVLKRKENELFGTNHVKQTSIHSVAKPARDDPIHNQLELFHKWLDRHRDMCEKLKNHHERLAKLKEEWENETHSGNTHPSDSNKTLNTDVSIQIHMDNPKPINEFTNMDTILDDLDINNEPYYDVQDDIYYDVNDHDTSTVDSNAMDVPSKVQIEMDVNTKLVKEKYPIRDVWDI
uniref:Variant-specific surface protein n=1 Tax=Plasmodium falciparum TaxID=5833 RepID=Q26032_PLAFA|nr:variant-specific surface protein [Plasmodium falciparum]